MKIAYIFGSTPLRHADEMNLELGVRKKSDWVGQTARAIAAEGHEVSVFIMHRKKSGVVGDNGVTWHICKAQVTHRKLIAGKEPSFDMCRRVLQSNPDLIHFNSIHFCVNFALYVLLARKYKIPIVGQHHGGRFPRHVWDRWALGYALKHSDHIIFPTLEEKQSYSQRFQLPLEQCSVLPCGYDKDFTIMDKSKAREITGMTGNPIILWLAQLVRRKDPLCVVKSFQGIVRKYPGARLYIIGSGEMEGKLREFSRSDALLTDTVIIKGYICHDELKPYFNAADIYVLASHQEGLPISLLEAMGCGLVPVVTSIPPCLHVTENGKYGLLFEPGNHKMLEEQLIKLIENDSFRSYLSLQAAERARNEFSWPVLSRKLVSLYAGVLQNRIGRI